MELTVRDIKNWLELTNETIQKHKAYLTELDQPIGDGDHGSNMAKGFQAVVSKVTNIDHETIADVLKDAAMTLISTVGGASGPLLGTAFLRMATALKEKDTLDPHTFSEALYKAVEGVKQRGKAAEGEKTLLDVWIPVADYLADTDAFLPDDISRVAKEAMENTKDMKATKGRAAYFGEKSIGHIDPGAVTSYYIFAALGEAMERSDH